MFRQACEYLTVWLTQARRKPLVIRGARQVGKSTEVRNFCARQKLELCEVNLEKRLELEAVFKSLDMAKILRELSAVIGKELLQENQLLFLDEIQATPSALAALRYFYEEYPQLPVIAAGSLLDFALQEHQFSIPVGRIEYFHMGPMTFKEFLKALGDEYLLGIIDNFDFSKPIANAAHDKLLQRQREYLLVGGMPEAIYAYSTTENLNEVSRIQESIGATFQDDFAKYTKNSRELLRLRNIINFIPGNIGRKIKYSEISREDQARDTKHALSLLSLARVISLIFHTSSSGLPLQAQENLTIFKCLFLDIGLMNKILGLDWKAVDTKDDRRLINEGGLAEQFIGQHLLYRHQGHQEPKLHYWLREERSTNAEVDYVISIGDWIIPIEVKAGTSGTLRSLHQFVYLKQTPLAVRFDANPPSITEFRHQLKVGENNTTISYKLLSLPLYLVEELTRLIELTRDE